MDFIEEQSESSFSEDDDVEELEEEEYN